MIIAQSTYSVFIEPKPDVLFTEWLGNQQYDQIFILCDENTEALCYPELAKYIPEHTIITIPSGETFKTIHTCTAIWEDLRPLHLKEVSILFKCQPPCYLRWMPV